VTVAVLLLALGAATTFVIVRATLGQAFAVDDCVAVVNSPEGAVADRECAAPDALYRVAHRENDAPDVDAACRRHEDATKAVAEPGSTGPDTVALCLSPTRSNMLDQAATLPGDCVDVTDKANTITRHDCAAPDASQRVLAVERQNTVPVTSACRAHPETRSTFVQPALGGHAIIVCAVPIDPTDADNGKVGDCMTEQDVVVTCGPAAEYRILKVQTGYSRPVEPMCAGVVNATITSLTVSEDSDFVVLRCGGPVAETDSGYADVGACIAKIGDGSEIRTCTAPDAAYRVTERTESENAPCPAGTTARITLPKRVTDGATICLAPK